MISVGCAGAPGPAATPATLAAPMPAVSTAAMGAHLKYLADDLLEGRAPATRGGRLAAKYIAVQFEALGLEPAGSDGSYFQPVALVGMTPHPSLVWSKGGATRSLAYLDDFVAWAERPESHIVADGEVVFVGYGIEASEWQWDDYKGADVRGKVLVMLVNDPGLQDSTIFNGRALTYYGRWTYKLEEAARRGALGAILVHTAESATYGWDVVRGSWSVEQFKLDRPAPQSIAFAAWVTHDAAQAALARANLNLDSLTRTAARRGAGQRIEVEVRSGEGSLGRVVRHPGRECDALRRGPIELELLHRPGTTHHIPSVRRALGGVDQDRAQRAAARRLFELVRPTTIIGQSPTVEDGRILEARIVHEHHEHLAANIRALVVVPLPLACLDAVADEHDLAIRDDVTLRPLSPRDEIIEISEGPGRATLAPHQRRVRGHADECYGLEVGAVATRGLQAERLELDRDVLRGQSAAARRRGAALEQVIGEVLEMRAHRRRAHGRHRGSERRRRCRGPWCTSAADGHHRDGDAPFQ